MHGIESNINKKKEQLRIYIFDLLDEEAGWKKLTNLFRSQTNHTVGCIIPATNTSIYWIDSINYITEINLYSLAIKRIAAQYELNVKTVPDFFGISTGKKGKAWLFNDSDEDPYLYNFSYVKHSFDCINWEKEHNIISLTDSFCNNE